MSKLIYAIIVGLVGAGLAHIAILFLVPQLTEHDMWRRLTSDVDINTPVRLDDLPDTPASLDDADPLFDVAACRFDLGDGPLRVSAEGETPFWSVSIYNEAGRNMQSFNDRASTQGALDFVVLTPTQMLDVRGAGVPEALAKSNFVESDTIQGIAVIRAFVEDASWKPTVAKLFQTMKCEPVDG